MQNNVSVAPKPRTITIAALAAKHVGVRARVRRRKVQRILLARTATAITAITATVVIAALAVFFLPSVVFIPTPAKL